MWSKAFCVLNEGLGGKCPIQCMHQCGIDSLAPRSSSYKWVWRGKDEILFIEIQQDENVVYAAFFKSILTCYICSSFTGTKKYPPSLYSFSKPIDYHQQELEQVFNSEQRTASPTWAMELVKQPSHSGESPLFVKRLLASGQMVSRIWLQYGYNMATIWLQYGYNMATIWLLLVKKLLWFFLLKCSIVW